MQALLLTAGAAIAVLGSLQALEVAYHTRTVAEYTETRNLPALLYKLRHGAPGERPAAALALGGLYDGVNPELPAALQEALRSPEIPVAAAAAQTLGELRDAPTLAALSTGLRHADREVRVAVVEALGQRPEPPAVGLLRRATRDADPQVRHAAREEVAQRQYQAATGLNRDDALVAQALALKRRGGLEEAERRLREALEGEPTHVQAHWILAWVLRDRGDTAGAREEFTIVNMLTTDPVLREGSRQALADLQSPEQ